MARGRDSSFARAPGRLQLGTCDETGGSGASVKVTVTIPPASLDEDTAITIELIDPTRAMLRVDLAFGQHGTHFKIPAEVKLDMKGLNLPGGGGGGGGDDDGYVIDFYWFDPDTQIWYVVPKNEKKYSVDYEQGRVKGIWYFSHFSRYSLSQGYNENCCWGYIPY